MDIKTTYQIPEESASDLVQSFWMMENNSGKDVEVVVLPDGIIDLFLFKSEDGTLSLELKGIDTEPSQVVIPTGTKMLSIGFKLLAVEYFLYSSVSEIVNTTKPLSNSFWQFDTNDFDHFENFCQKAKERIRSIPLDKIDPRKKKLFHLIYQTNGNMPVQEMAQQSGWSARQINRYFNQYFGISLKTYCGILRFRASFEDIKEGKLFSGQNFFDQAHFIKEVKKLAGVVPKELRENKNDRFIQLSILPPR